MSGCIGYIGRKVYLDWGKDLILSIEKIKKTPMSIDELNLTTDKDGNILPAELFNICSILGCRTEVRVGAPAYMKKVKCMGLDVNEVVERDSMWATETELTLLYRSQIIKERVNLTLENEYSFNVGESLTVDQYNEITPKCTIIKVYDSEEKEEGFYGFIFNNESLENYKALCDKITFIAGNTTLCGCLSGTVYNAKINARGDVILNHE